MSSFWPFRRDSTSPASFERALSKLSARINAQSSSLDRSRSSSRRVRALFTLYTTLAYLVYTLILTLVLGHRRWNIGHYAGLLGAPPVIYAVRRTMEGAWGWRISRLEKGLDELLKQREEKIKQLKEATKYNSTQELIRKYGGDTPKDKTLTAAQGTKRKATSSDQHPPTPSGGRTGIAPPPTANIPRSNVPSPPPPQPNDPNTPLRPSSSTPQPRQSRQSPITPASPTPSESESFAPNAFPSYPPPPQSNQSYAPPTASSSHWYDRLLDVLLGEDEALAKNRLALICANCRLVNGQAPPGVKNLAEVGRWRCGGCGAMNGRDLVDEGKMEVRKAVAELERKGEKEGKGWENVAGRGKEAEDGPGDEEQLSANSSLRDLMRQRTQRERATAVSAMEATDEDSGIEDGERHGDADADADEEGDTGDLDEMHGDAGGIDQDAEDKEEEKGGEEIRKPVTRSAVKSKDKGKGKVKAMGKEAS